MRRFVRIYEEFTDSSGFEHINPNLVKRVYVDSEEEGKVWVAVHYWLESEEAEYIPFDDHKAAQRFIKRLGDIINE